MIQATTTMIKNFQYPVVLNRVMLLVVLPILIGCSSSKQVLFKASNLPDEVIISKELNTVLNAKTKPTVVIRVPTATTTVTTKEREGNLTLVYNEMEKYLVKAGFTVRDRGLLNNLLANSSTSSQADYEEIGRKIQTDLIIEIMDIDFEINDYTAKCDSALYKKEMKMIQLIPPATYSITRAKMQAKIVIVSKGQNGGYLTFNYTPCVEGCDASFYVDDGKGHFSPGTFQDKYSVSFKHFSEQLIKALNNALLAK